ncbi:DUF3152 domain-containing protein [Streptomyces sp. TS71-3]|uniref:DUF3152 domain-containing protein n=1 Tax=Streptomyces sp. TS71-3 TaxID=2733862 RepID=UPI001B024AED|nr:DUF3152 domain-containing protein [Streptomyces sp. TS71-3]GHJ35818.1 hypothetical protein Sm713_14270 [Streptomyces sp. TS71-3]
MGRHSRRGPADSGDTGGMPVVPGEPTSGRRGRSDGPERFDPDPRDTPQHGIPQVPSDGTPARGTPRPEVPGAARRGPGQVRGGHPEHREPGGGWGASDAAPLESPQRPGDLFGGRPGDARTASSPTYGTGSFPGLTGAAARASRAGGIPPGPAESRRRGPASRIVGTDIPGPPAPGPRQEYIDAFDDEHAPDHGNDDDVNAATPRGTSGTETAASKTLVAHPGSRSGDDPVPTASPSAGPGRAGGADGEDEPPKAKAGKGRTLAGVAAAAVTTVLAMVVAGQVTEGRHDGSATAQSAGEQRAGGGAPSRSRQRHSTARPAPAPAPLTYDQKMGKKYPLGPKTTASGKFDAVMGFAKASGKGELFRYRVDVEKGLGLDGELFAQAVQKTLNDNRSWAHDGGRTFERVSSGEPDFVITLASPGTTAAWCAKSGLDTTEDNVSCDSASTDRVMINAYRWAQGAKTYGNAIHPYRQMLINHEVGHRLGFNHVVCTKNGSLAPVMQQQTKFLTYDGITCKPNAWPFPDA